MPKLIANDTVIIYTKYKRMYTRISAKQTSTNVTYVCAPRLAQTPWATSVVAVSLVSDSQPTESRVKVSELVLC